MAPLTAAASLPLTNHLLLAAPASPAQQSSTSPHLTFQLITQQSQQDAMRTLQATPGNKNLLEAKGLPFAMVLTTEVAKSAKEFEYHENRDHIVQIVDGVTIYEVGGIPTTPRNTSSGEWLAPASEGATVMTLKKGDMLILPRGTPHKRRTETSVTFVLISTTGATTT